MQVDPMQDDIGIFESLFERGSGRNTHDHAAVDGVEHGDRIRDDRLLEHGLTDAETIEHMKYVGAELDAVTDCTKFRCFSRTLTGHPFRPIARAAVRPPIPPPTI